jgi:hypothetical protein
MTEMVDLYVGSEKTHFHAHKDLLCKKIPYFNKMFKGGFKKCSDGVGTFPKDSAESFDILLKWVYSRTLQTLNHTEDPQTRTIG